MYGGALSLRIDGLHDLIDVSATVNDVSFEPALQAPGAWAAGGLPAAALANRLAMACAQWTLPAARLCLTYTGRRRP